MGFCKAITSSTWDQMMLISSDSKEIIALENWIDMPQKNMIVACLRHLVFIMLTHNLLPRSMNIKMQSIIKLKAIMICHSWLSR